MGTEDDPAAVGHGCDIVHENNAAFLEAADDRRVMHDLMKNVQGRAMGFERALNDLDGTGYAGTKALCSREKDLH